MLNNKKTTTYVTILIILWQSKVDDNNLRVLPLILQRTMKQIYIFFKFSKELLKVANSKKSYLTFLRSLFFNFKIKKFITRVLKNLIFTCCKFYSLKDVVFKNVIYRVIFYVLLFRTTWHAYDISIPNVVYLVYLVPIIFLCKLKYVTWKVFDNYIFKLSIIFDQLCFVASLVVEYNDYFP
jgi:hypothetical protein